MPHAKNFQDLSGQPFGLLIVIEETAPYRSPSGRGLIQWLCECKCGNMTVVRASCLKRERGGTKSCGCLRRNNRHNMTHGLSKSPEYDVWCGMIHRCENPKDGFYDDYGGRGITIDSAWRHSFETFIQDMGQRPSPKHKIERLNNDGPYSKANCIWATQAQQSRNTRQNHWITFQGQTLCLADWDAALGYPKGTIRNRLYRKWSPECAITTPVIRGKGQYLRRLPSTSTSL